MEKDDLLAKLDEYFGLRRHPSRLSEITTFGLSPIGIDLFLQVNTSSENFHYSAEELDLWLSGPTVYSTTIAKLLDSSYQKIFNHRAKFGLKILKKCKALRETGQGEEPNMCEFIPSNYGFKSDKNNGKQMIVFEQGKILKYDFPNLTQLDGWVLKFEKALSFAPWNDPIAIKKLATFAGDDEACQIAYALKYPGERA